VRTQEIAIEVFHLEIWTKFQRSTPALKVFLSEDVGTRKADFKDHIAFFLSS
jgi:hypothetical protein